MMPTSGTKESLIFALKNYIFSNEQLQEMIRFQEKEKSLLTHEFRRRRVETLINGPRPYEYRTQIAIDFFNEDDAKLTHF